MGELEKYRFDTVFDAAGNIVSKPVPKPKTRFTAEEMEAVRADGFEEGSRSAEAQAAEAAATALKDIAADMKTLISTLTDEVVKLKTEASVLAFETARALAPELIADKADANLEGLIGACLAQLRSEPKITIHVAEALAQDIEDRIGEIARQNHFEGHVTIRPSQDASRTTCQLEWDQGGADYDLNDQIEEIRKLIGDHLSANGPNQLDMFATATEDTE